MKSDKLLNAMGDIRDGLILDAAPGKAERKPRRLRRGLAVALAAALILTLTVGVGAAGGFKGLTDVFAPAFYNDGSAPAPDPEMLEKMGHPVGASVTENGVTVTLESVLRDRYTCTMVTSVKMKGLDGNLVDYNWLEGGGALAGFCNPGGSTRDMTPGDDTIQIIRTWESDTPIPAGKATVTISDIVLNQHRFLREETIEGTWELEFDTGYEDLSRDLPAGQALTVEGVDVTVDEITVSPLTMMVKYTADPAGADMEQVVDTEPYERTLQMRLGELDCVITKKDGTQFAEELGAEEPGHIKGSSSGAKEEDGLLKYYNLLRFDQLLPLDEIASITIEGVEVPIEGLTE